MISKAIFVAVMAVAQIDNVSAQRREQQSSGGCLDGISFFGCSTAGFSTSGFCSAIVIQCIICPGFFSCCGYLPCIPYCGQICCCYAPRVSEWHMWDCKHVQGNLYKEELHKQDVVSVNMTIGEFADLAQEKVRKHMNNDNLKVEYNSDNKDYRLMSVTVNTQYWQDNLFVGVVDDKIRLMLFSKNNTFFQRDIKKYDEIEVEGKHLRGKVGRVEMKDCEPIKKYSNGGKMLCL